MVVRGYRLGVDACVADLASLATEVLEIPTSLAADFLLTPEASSSRTAVFFSSGIGSLLPRLHLPLDTQSSALSLGNPADRWSGLTHLGLSHECMTTIPSKTGP